MHKLGRILEGWDGYQTSLMRAMTPLTGEQLSWRLAPERRSVGELVRHLSLGRITWLTRMGAPGIDAVVRQIPRWYTDGDGARHAVEEAVPCDQATVLAEWLARSWLPIQLLLDEWTVDDLFQSYPHRFRGVDYLVSRQWTLWRVMSHDLHHGGQIATMLAVQNVDAFELRALGGHIIAPPMAEPAR